MMIQHLPRWAVTLIVPLTASAPTQHTPMPASQNPAARVNAPNPGARLVGSWSLVAVDNVLSDGSHVHIYGDNPQGMLMFDARGHYTLEIMRSGRPTFAANDRTKGTDVNCPFVIRGDHLIYTVPAPSTGGATVHGEVEWKRVA